MDAGGFLAWLPTLVGTSVEGDAYYERVCAKTEEMQANYDCKHARSVWDVPVVLNAPECIHSYRLLSMSQVRE